jgi:hypothetical protein
MRALELHCDIEDGIDGLGELMKELKSCSKQVLGKPPKEVVTEAKAYLEKRKTEKKEKAKRSETV